MGLPPTACSTCFLIQSGTTSPRMALSQMGWDLPSQSLIRKRCHKQTHEPLWRRHFLSWASLFSDGSSLYQVDKNHQCFTIHFLFLSYWWPQTSCPSSSRTRTYSHSLLPTQSVTILVDLTAFFKLFFSYPIALSGNSWIWQQGQIQGAFRKLHVVLCQTKNAIHDLVFSCHICKVSWIDTKYAKCYHVCAEL